MSGSRPNAVTRNDDWINLAHAGAEVLVVDGDGREGCLYGVSRTRLVEIARRLGTTAAPAWIPRGSVGVYRVVLAGPALRRAILEAEAAAEGGDE